MDVVKNVRVQNATPLRDDEELPVDLNALECLKSQVGGHVGIFLSSVKDGKVLKRCIPEEVDFFRYLAKHSVCEEFFPDVWGTVTLSLTVGDETVEGALYVIMEDLTAGYVKPSILDIKIGTIPWGIDTVGAKLEKQLKKRDATTTGSLGFRITGMKVWYSKLDRMEVLDRSFGHNLKDQDVPAAIRRFASDGENDLCGQVLPPYLEQLAALERWQRAFGTNHFAFHGTSLFFIYEGSSADGSAVSSAAPAQVPRPRLCMIDFPHTEYLQSSGATTDSAPAEDRDGVMMAIHNLQRIFTELL